MLALGMDVILDLHWLTSGQSPMPDSNSATFWQQVAAKYKNEGRVIFEIYNEPNGTNDGGVLEDGNAAACRRHSQHCRRKEPHPRRWPRLGLSPGLVLPPTYPGLTESTSPTALTHPYDIKTNGAVDTSAWDAAFGNLAKTYPVVATEFGETTIGGGSATATQKKCNADFYNAMLSYFADSSRTIGWTGWSWFVDHYNSGSLTPIRIWNRPAASRSSSHATTERPTLPEQP